MCVYFLLMAKVKCFSTGSSALRLLETADTAAAGYADTVPDTTSTANSSKAIAAFVVVNDTSSVLDLEESKIYIKFCLLYLCKDKVKCYCCDNKPSEDCFGTRKQCLAACPACKPKCPPRPTFPILKRVMNVT